MRVVVALGGNALLRRGEPLDDAVQHENVRAAARSLVPIAREHELVITHGNGPQVGLLALQAAALPGVAPSRLDVLSAETAGMIGFMLECELAGALPDRSTATLLTMVEIDPDDRAFERPTKPIGPVYPESAASRLAIEHGWTVTRDGDGWRRAVASPSPRRILELEAIRRLLDARTVIICAGGGGVPVAWTDGRLAGIEAVVDKDATSALLAREIGADCLVLATDVVHVELGWGTATPEPITTTTWDALAAHAFAPGSMAPKVAAACEFVRETGRRAAIGSLGDIASMVAGTSGTQILPRESS